MDSKGKKPFLFLCQDLINLPKIGRIIVVDCLLFFLYRMSGIGREYLLTAKEVGLRSYTVGYSCNMNAAC